MEFGLLLWQFLKVKKTWKKTGEVNGCLGNKLATAQSLSEQCQKSEGSTVPDAIVLEDIYPFTIQSSSHTCNIYDTKQSLEAT